MIASCVAVLLAVDADANDADGAADAGGAAADDVYDAADAAVSLC